MNHHIVKKKLTSSLKLYSSLKFTEKGITRIKSGTEISLEDTGKVHTDADGKTHKVFRMRKNTRNYYTLETLIK